MSLFNHLYQDYFPDEHAWSMTHEERMAVIYLLKLIKPKISLEIGSEYGGSTRVIAHHSEQVYAIDIDPAVEARLKPYQNVDFICGDSKVQLPKLLDSIKEPINFILIDGDHSIDGVLADCRNILTYQPEAPLYIVMHDSFNPDCRQGMLSADWGDNPYVHHVELDFVKGHFSAFDKPNEMWGGLALAVMKPTKRTTSLHIVQTHRQLYEALLPQSIYYEYNQGFSK